MKRPSLARFLPRMQWDLQPIVRRMPGRVAVLAIAGALGWASHSPLVAFLTVLILVSRRGTHQAAWLGMAFAILLAAVQFTGRPGASEIAATWFLWTVAAGIIAGLTRAEEMHGEGHGASGAGMSLGIIHAVGRFPAHLWAAAREPLADARLARAIYWVGPVGVALAIAFIAWVRPSLGAGLAALAIAGVLPFAFWAMQSAGGYLPSRRTALIAAAVVILAGAEVVVPSVWQMPSPGGQVAFDFVARHTTGRLSTTLQKPAVSDWTIGWQTRRVLVMRPTNRGPTRLIYHVSVPDRAVLAFGIGIAPETWDRPIGDGMTFKVMVDGEEESDVLFDRYLNAKNRPEERRWYDVRLDMAQYAGKNIRLIFIVQAGPWNDARSDLGGWSEPLLWQRR